MNRRGRGRRRDRHHGAVLWSLPFPCLITTRDSTRGCLRADAAALAGQWTRWPRYQGPLAGTAPGEIGSGSECLK
jgi:hypothetical protein